MRGLVIDVTKLKQAQEEKDKLLERLYQARKMEALGVLAGGVAHDLNNFLNGLVATPDLLLLELPDKSPLRKRVKSMKASAEKAAALVKDLLTIARGGKRGLEALCLNRIVTDYLNSDIWENTRVHYPGVKIMTALGKNLPQVLGSSIHLTKTIINLVSNAAEAMPEGGEILISTRKHFIDDPPEGSPDQKQGDYVVLSVSDTGTGISPEDLSRIFEPFFTKKKIGRSGTGLGMTIVWRTVKDHDGFIDVTSNQGKGTSFDLYFPVKGGGQMSCCEKPVSNEIPTGKEKVLVCDDMKEHRKTAAEILRRLGYSVDEVSSGEEAVNYIALNNPDLLILDMVMPEGMDGLDTYKKILELRPEQKVIITSGYSNTNRIMEVRNLGAGQFIKKPYTMKEISTAIRTELGKG